MSTKPRSMSGARRLGRGWRSAAIYVVTPLLGTGLLVVAYGLGPAWARDLVAPRMNRELGLLENLQVVVLVAALAVVLRHLVRIRGFTHGAIAAGTGLFLVVVLGEELNYGLHLLGAADVLPSSWSNGAGPGEPVSVTLHNLSGLETSFEWGRDLALALWFGITPSAGLTIRWPSFRLYRPSRWCLGTLVVGVVVSALATWLTSGLPVDHSLASNTSEFRELVTYYLFLVYVVSVARRLERRDPVPPGSR